MSTLGSFEDMSVERRSFLKLLVGGLALSAFSDAPGWGAPVENVPSVDEDCQRGIQSLKPSASELGERFEDPTRGAKQLGFVRSALAVELDHLYVDFHEGFLRGPKCFHQSFVRAYVHEVLHFWQALSQGFITNLALQEWQHVQEFKQTGALKDSGGLLSRFAEPPKDGPFSAWELSESLCRFWDIHILGPERLLQERGDPMARVGNDFRPYSAEEFDRVMTIEDSYAAPYRWALDHWGTSASVLLFPIAGHFAMQTRRPVDVFVRVGENLRVQAQQMHGSIHENWRTVFPQVRQACEHASLNLTGASLTPGWDVIGRSGLRKTPIWHHYLKLLNGASILSGGTEQLDFFFSLPGDPECRGNLISVFLPTVTLFRNGRWFGESSFVRSIQETRERTSTGDNTLRVADGLSSPRSLADSAEAIVRDYRAMRQWITLRRYGR